MSSIVLKIEYTDKKDLSYKILKNISEDLKKVLDDIVKDNENIFLNYSVKKTRAKSI